MMTNSDNNNNGNAMADEASSKQEQEQPTIEVRNLSFNYWGKDVLESVNISLPRGSRCLLVGANGAGKSTLLRVLSGKHMAKHDECRILDVRGASLQDQCGGLAYVGNNWTRSVAFAGSQVAYEIDMPIKDMMSHLQKDPALAARRKKLYQVLDINPEWRMNKVSDGQRRRCQIMLGMLKPFQFLLMDEITVDLDVVARQDLLAFLREETEQRGVTLIYATHIFDGLDDWATHVARLKNKRIECAKRVEDMPELQQMRLSQAWSPMMLVVEKWLREEKLERKEMEQVASEKVEDLAMKTYGSDGPFSNGVTKHLNYW